MQDPSVISSSPPKAQSPALALPATGFVRQKLLLRFVPFSRATLWRRVRDRSFPAPIKISAGVTAWRVEEVRRWIVEQGSR